MKNPMLEAVSLVLEKLLFISNFMTVRMQTACLTSLSSVYGNHSYKGSLEVCGVFKLLPSDCLPLAGSSFLH